MFPKKNNTGVEAIACQSQMSSERVLIKQSIADACSNTMEWYLVPDEDQEEFVSRMERDCFNKVVNNCIMDGIDRFWTNPVFRQRYSAEIYKLLANLDVSSSVNSSWLVEKIIDGSIDPSKIATMSSIDLCPEASKSEREMIELRKNQNVTHKVSRNYICRKCGGNETKLYEKQTRAADESSTIFKLCIICDFCWV